MYHLFNITHLLDPLSYDLLKPLNKLHFKGLSVIHLKIQVHTSVLVTMQRMSLCIVSFNL